VHIDDGERAMSFEITILAGETVRDQKMNNVIFDNLS